MTSSLNKIYRLPKINITLPSGGKFYDKEFIKLSIDNSLPIRAMTAQDEIMLKSPDALLNGDCLIHIIESCVPDVKDVKKLSAPDVEAILLGIFYSSYGPTLEFKSTCPECGHVNSFELEIKTLLDIASTNQPNNIVTVDLGIVDEIPTSLVFELRPYTFETNTKHQLMVFEHGKLLQILGNDFASDEEKLKAFNDSFKKMVLIKFENVVDCINNIKFVKTINNEIQSELITDRKEITDFIFNADKSLVEPVMEKIEELNASGVNNTFDAICGGRVDRIVNGEAVKETCGHTWKSKVEFNPVNFFARRSSR